MNCENWSASKLLANESKSADETSEVEYRIDVDGVTSAPVAVDGTAGNAKDCAFMFEVYHVEKNIRYVCVRHAPEIRNACAKSMYWIPEQN